MESVGSTTETQTTTHVAAPTKARPWRLLLYYSTLYAIVYARALSPHFDLGPKAIFSTYGPCRL